MHQKPKNKQLLTPGNCTTRKFEDPIELEYLFEQYAAIQSRAFDYAVRVGEISRPVTMFVKLSGCSHGVREMIAELAP